MADEETDWKLLKVVTPSNCSFQVAMGRRFGGTGERDWVASADELYVVVQMTKNTDKRAKKRSAVSKHGDRAQSQKWNESLFRIVMLPCLRCGNLAVPIIPIFFFRGESACTFPCRICWAEHYLSVVQEGSMFLVQYQRYTLRYPLEHYDEGVIPLDVTLHLSGTSTQQRDDDCYLGPIIVYPRKRHFAKSEVETIWKATNGRCHICNHHWRLDQRGRRGWHIDHVIPHIGGGSDTELLSNLRVACAACNLKKGKGYTQSAIRQGLRELVEYVSSVPGA